MPSGIRHSLLCFHSRCIKIVKERVIEQGPKRCLQLHSTIICMTLTKHAQTMEELAVTVFSCHPNNSNISCLQYTTLLYFDFFYLPPINKMLNPTKPLCDMLKEQMHTKKAMQNTEKSAYSSSKWLNQAKIL